MNCPRCNATMFRTQLRAFVGYDHEAAEDTIELDGYRCPACGEVIDAVILKNRLAETKDQPKRCWMRRVVNTKSRRGVG